MASQESEVTSWTWAAMEPEPPDTERQLLDQFCAEILIDGDATRAASRCGFQAGFAEQYGKLFYQKSYVQRKLRAMRESAPQSTDVEKDALKRLTVVRLRDVLANPYSNGADVVRASAELGKIYGWHAPPPRVEEGSRGGGVVLVPVGSLDDWEASAKASQQALIEASRV